jgi:capsule polysaccharide export protein KpsE/RkpR
MTKAEQITHLKAQLAKANEAIRELNERASSHLRASQDAIQALKLELDKANAKLRNSAAGFPVFDKLLLKERGVKLVDTFHDCTGVPIGVGKITAPVKTS